MFVFKSGCRDCGQQELAGEFACAEARLHRAQRKWQGENSGWEEAPELCEEESRGEGALGPAGRVGWRVVV